MSTLLDIQLKRADKVYREGENITGIVIITANSDLKHDGITLTVEGSVSIQLSSKNVGIIDAFYNSVKPIQLISVTCDVSGPGRLPSGRTEIPFEVPLKPKPNRALHETYHGVYVNVSYAIRCDIRRSFLSKDLTKSQQFLVQYRPGGAKPEPSRKPDAFDLSPKTFSNSSAVAAGVYVPSFGLSGRLDATYCSITEPLTGHVVNLKESGLPIRSVEVQLVRVETCGCAEGYAREATEIQNIQIGDGDIPLNVPIPIYMIFPRLFTCPTLITPNFKIEFEVNVVVIFQDDHLLTYNIPITLVRD